METINCLVVDDESLARKLLEENISQIPFLKLVGMCKNPMEAMQKLHEENIDLLFLDIQMPGMLGTQFLNSLRNPPLVIFVTAYSNYAVESYELEVVDYLMKPVSFERFMKACLKAHEIFKKSTQEIVYQQITVPKEESILASEYFFVNADYSIVKIKFSEITHIEGLKDYVKIYLKNQAKPILTKSTLKNMEEKLPSSRFFRVHKSFIVNLEQIESIRSQRISLDKHLIPVSDVNSEELLQLLNYKKS
jgi:two-component system, LytTR family, response regulator